MLTIRRLKPATHKRVVLVFVDQAVNSISNFITGVAIAQLSGAAQFGEYMLVLMIWLVAVGVHRRLISEPMIVVSRSADTHAALVADGLRAELILGGVASAGVAAAGLIAVAVNLHIGSIMVALSPWFVPLLVQDYWRAVAFQRRRPDLALANDVVFAIVQVAVIFAFVAIGWRTAGYMIGAWGAGAAAGAILGFRWFPALGGWRDGWQLLRRLWPRGRWLLADYITAFASQQAYVAVAAIVISKTDYGGFRAAASLVGPVMVILLAAGNIGLPEASRRLDSGPTAVRRYARRLSLGTVCCVGAYGLALAIAARPLLRVMYGAEFARFAPLAILASLQYLIMVSVYGQGIWLRATGAVRRLWPLRLVTAPASLASLVLLVDWLGLNGAGWAGVATGAFDALAIYFISRRVVSEEVGSPGDTSLRRGAVEPAPWPSVISSDGATT